jgi:hypothetical protein
MVTGAFYDFFLFRKEKHTCVQVAFLLSFFHFKRCFGETL